MKKRQLAKPKPKITKASKKTTGKLCEQYAQILRLRVEIARLSSTKRDALDSGLHVGQ